MSAPGSAGSDSLPADVAPVRLPDAARVFTVRALRFRELAGGHPAGAFLELLGAVADGQALACAGMPVGLGARLFLSPVPLQADAWPRTQVWRDALSTIVGHVCGVPAPAETSAACSRLSAMPVDDLEQMADAVVRGETPADAAAAVFVAAALQAYWTALAALVPLELVHQCGGRACPVCGSPPAAGAVLGDRPVRYLTCFLCATAWHFTRLTCAHCGSKADLSYYVVEGAPPGVKAEACGACRRYAKLFYGEERPAAEPLADDVATVALDLRLAEEGFRRAGRNPFLMG